MSFYKFVAGNTGTQILRSLDGRMVRVSAEYPSRDWDCDSVGEPEIHVIPVTATEQRAMDAVTDATIEVWKTRAAEQAVIRQEIDKMKAARNEAVRALYSVCPVPEFFATISEIPSKIASYRRELDRTPLGTVMSPGRAAQLRQMAARCKILEEFEASYGERLRKDCDAVNKAAFAQMEPLEKKTRALEELFIQELRGLDHWQKSLVWDALPGGRGRL